MDDRIATELRLAIDRHAANPELRELWLRVLGLQLLVESASEDQSFGEDVHSRQ
jgi:hypothetical protein